MPSYNLHGKLADPLSLGEFVMKAGVMPTDTVKQKRALAFATILYFTGVRVSELTRATRAQFKIKDEVLYFDVGPRLKHGNTTPALQIPMAMPYMDNVAHVLHYAKKDLIFPFNRITAYRIIRDYFNAYPHYFRLNRITQFLLDGFSLPEIKSWSGHKSLQSIDAYVGRANVTKMGQSLKPKQS